MRRLVSLLSILLIAAGVAAAPDPVIATFSIVGHDPETGELGVAVQSKFFAVGAVVPYAEAGVGALATQAFANTTYGPRGLELLRAGKLPAEVVEELTASDEQAAQRQLGVVDAQGRSAAHTGDKCQPWAGHLSGKNFTAQGNILVGEETVQAMARAFTETEGMLGEKLMRALEEGQAAGGDSRGMQSAAIYIVKKNAGYGGQSDVYCDLRVDDHTAPIGELRRIFGMWKINALILDGYNLVERGEYDRAIACGKEAVALAPTDAEPPYHLGCYYARAGKLEEALEALTASAALDPKLGVRAATDPDYTPLYEDERFKKLSAADAGAE